MHPVRPRTATHRAHALAAALGAAALVAAGLVATTSTPAEAAIGDVIWSQEFNGSAGSAPDSAVWSYDTGAGGWGNAELQNYTTSRNNSALDGQGNLVITARREGDGSYTSARLQSNDKFEAEVRPRRGPHPDPARPGHLAGVLDARRRLPPDVVAVLAARSTSWRTSARSRTASTARCTAPATRAAAASPASYQHPQNWSFADTFHTFAVDWKPGSITWSVDGNVFHQVTTASVGGNPWVFDKPYFLILNVAVGGQWPGYPDGTTQFPQQMKVDYVRVYDNGSGSAAAGAAARSRPAPARSASRTRCASTCPGRRRTTATRSRSSAATATPPSSGPAVPTAPSARSASASTSAAAGPPTGPSCSCGRATGPAPRSGRTTPATRALKNPQSGRCLDAVGGTPVHDGQRVNLWDCHGGANQQWYL